MSYQAIKPTQTTAIAHQSVTTAQRHETWKPTQNSKQRNWNKLVQFFIVLYYPTPSFKAVGHSFEVLWRTKCSRVLTRKLIFGPIFSPFEWAARKYFLTSQRRTSHLPVMVSLRILASFSHQLNGGAGVPLKIYSIQWDHAISFQSR